MKVVFSNPNIPSNGMASIPLPIPKTEYDQCILTLGAIGVGDVLAADCMVEEIENEYPILQRLVNSTVNVDELDYLVKRLESFDARELGQFQCIASSRGIHNVRDFINLTFCCQNTTVVQDFSDLKRIGEFCYMDRNGGGMTSEEMQGINFENLAIDLLQNENGKVTPYGVIYDKEFQIEQLYNGRNFPQYQFEECIMDVEVTTGEAMDCDISPVCFCLPMSDLQLERIYGIMTLAIYARKCGIDEDELRQAAFDLLGQYDDMSEDEINRFTEHDIVCALEMYNEDYVTFPRDDIGKLSGLQMPVNKRNGRKQDQHLTFARGIREVKSKMGESVCGGGRPSAAATVREYQQQHPAATKAEVIRGTGLSKPTVYKYYAAGGGEGVSD